MQGLMISTCEGLILKKIGLWEIIMLIVSNYSEILELFCLKKRERNCLHGGVNTWDIPQASSNSL